MLAGPFRGSHAVVRGVVTEGLLRGRGFVRLYPNVYVAADTEVDLRVLSRAAYLLVAEQGGPLAGWSATELLGAPCAPVGMPAEVLVAGHIRTHPCLRVTRGSAAGPDLWTVRGCRLTSPLRTAWDLARRTDLVDAVVAVDALAARGGFAPSALLDRRRTTPGARGSRRLDRVVALAEPRAESPMETRLRLLLSSRACRRPRSSTGWSTRLGGSWPGSISPTRPRGSRSSTTAATTPTTWTGDGTCARDGSGGTPRASPDATSRVHARRWTRCARCVSSGSGCRAPNGTAPFPERDRRTARSRSTGISCRGERRSGRVP